MDKDSKVAAQKDWQFKRWLLLPQATLQDGPVSMGSRQRAFLSLPLVGANVPSTKYGVVGVRMSLAVHASGFSKIWSLGKKVKSQPTVLVLLHY